MDKEQLKNYLEEMASAKDNISYPVSLEYHETLGAVPWRREEISIKKDGNQRFYTIRCMSDGGGTPIGNWEDKANPQHLQDIIAAMVSCKIWDVEDEPISPGGGYIEYSFDIDGQKHTIIISDMSMVGMELGQVDMLFRRVVNDLEKSAKGGALECILSIPEGKAETYSVELKNIGNIPIIIRNPLPFSGPLETRYQHFRLEFAKATEREPKYKPVRSEFQIADDSMKDDLLVEIKPGKSFVATTEVIPPRKKGVR